MKLQLVAAEAGESPLVRLYDFTVEEAERLRVQLGALADGAVQTLPLAELPFITALNNFNLTAILDDRARDPDRDYSIIPGTNPNAFIWRESAEGWQHVCELLQPFTEALSPTSYAWLTDDLGIPILLSSSGSW